MKEFLDYVVKNKWVIICVAVVVVLYALGIVEFLTKAGKKSRSYSIPTSLRLQRRNN